MEKNINIKKNIKKIFKLLIISFSLVGILEIISFFIYKNLPVELENGKNIVEAYLGKQNPYLKRQIMPHPYLLYVNTPNYVSDGFKQHNSLGYRGDEITIEKPKDTIRILVLGDSTAYEVKTVNPEDVWVHLLEEKLQTISSKKIQVINGGLQAATSAELLSSYVFRHRFLNPDLVIIHAGFGDFMALVFENYNPEYTHFRAPGQSISSRPFEKIILKSNIMKILYARWLNGISVVFQEVPGELSMSDRQKALERVKNNKSEGFRRNLDYLVKLIKQDGADVIIAFPVFWKKHDESKTIPELRGWTRHAAIVMPLHFQIEKDIAKKYGTFFVNFDNNLFNQDWFYDFGHLNKDGQELRAKIMFDFFKNNLILNKFQ